MLTKIGRPQNKSDRKAAANSGFKKLAISEHKTVNLHESLIEKLNLI
jgi:hypothetical protein